MAFRQLKQGLNSFSFPTPLLPEESLLHSPDDDLHAQQIKDQSKKMSNLKHMEQLEKSRNAQLMDDAKKREDNLNQSSQQIKVRREEEEEEEG
ncbi:hypothetical protein NQZ68_021187 [Dissostichus eleginoides]|nr:hypothetical protein NQZ68_021187 [Dissostichus eleginoides]